MAKSLVIWVIRVLDNQQNGAAVDVSAKMASYSCFYEGTKVCSGCLCYVPHIRHRLMSCHWSCDPWWVKISGHSDHVVGWVGLWGFLWWAPSAKRKDHHRVNSAWSSVWHRSNTGLSSTQYEQIPIILRVWPFWMTPFFFGQKHFGGLMVKLHFLCWNYSLSSGWHIIAA